MEAKAPFARRAARPDLLYRFLFIMLRSAIAVVALGASATAVTAQTTKRLALVIGNDNYRQVSALSNARNDAKAMAVELSRAGFDVTTKLDQSHIETLTAVAAFTKRITPGDEVALFFAGHGVQLKTGNYLLPVDVPGTSETVVRGSSLALDDLMDQIKEAGPRFTLMVIDACRDNPFKGNGRSIGEARGLRPPEPPRGQLVVFSASRGQQAIDKLGAKDTDPNGLFTREFIKKMRQKGVSVEQVAREVQSTVERLAADVGKEQVPSIYNESRGNFYFFVGDGGTVNIAAPTGQSSGTTAPPIAPATANLADLQNEQKIRKQWAEWQKRMRADFDAVSAFNGEADLEIKAWERFLATWSANNPATEEDDNLRAQAKEKIQRANQKLMQDNEARAQAARLAALSSAAIAQSFKDCADCPEMVTVPAGGFLMGSPESERAAFLSARGKDTAFNWALPQRRVTIANNFAVGKFEVTKGQYAAFVAETNRGAPDGCFVFVFSGSTFEKMANKSWRDVGFEQSSNDPAACISWEDAKAYAAWLGRKTGKPYRLLSEAEWEYAARAGTDTAFYVGSIINSAQVNFDGEVTYNGGTRSGFRKKTIPVGSLNAPNKFGLHDMHGNVWEWVEDCWNDSYNGAPSNAAAWLGGECRLRGLRGGSWLDVPRLLRSSNRGRSVASDRYNYNGFRIARTLP